MGFLAEGSVGCCGNLIPLHPVLPVSFVCVFLHLDISYVAFSTLCDPFWWVDLSKRLSVSRGSESGAFEETGKGVHGSQGFSLGIFLFILTGTLTRMAT